MRADRVLPLARELRRYERRWLTPDLIAGLTVWALLVPEAIAYAAVAGMPPEAGLYTALPALVLYALFGTSRQLFVGPSSAVALLSASTVAAVVGSGSEDFFAATSALAIMVGLICVVAGLLRLGFVSDFLSKPILDGFIAGLALVIVVGQAPKLFGVEGVSGDFFEELWGLIRELGDTNGATLVVGAASLALLFTLERFVPRLPGALAVVALSIGAVSVFDLEAKRGVEVVGTIPTGLPELAFPSLGGSVWAALFGGAVGIVLVAYAETIAAARKYASKHGDTIDPDQEFIGLGAANIGAGLFQGFTVDGSLSKTAAADEAGQRTQVANLVNAVFVLLTILFLATVFENLAEATLGAVVVHAVWHLAVNPALWRRLWALRRTEFALAAVCALGVMTIDVLPGLILAVTLSLLVLVYRASRPRTAVLGLPPGAEREDVRMRDVAEHPGDRTIPGLIVYRFEAELFFANANTFTSEIESLVHEADTPVSMVLVDAEAITGIDLTAAEAAVELQAKLADGGVTLAFSRVRAFVRQQMAQTGLLDVVGEENLFETTSAGVDAFTRWRA
jgi:SulP family sulfate permease